MKPLDLWIGNDNLLDIEELSDEATGELITSATVTVTITGPAGETVGNPQDWPITLAEDRPGRFVGTVRYDTPLQPGYYRAAFQVITNTGGIGAWTKRCRARVRA